MRLWYRTSLSAFDHHWQGKYTIWITDESIHRKWIRKNFHDSFSSKTVKATTQICSFPCFFCQYESNPNMQQGLIISEAKWDIWKRHLGLWELVVGFFFIQDYHLLAHKNKKYKSSILYEVFGTWLSFRTARWPIFKFTHSEQLNKQNVRRLISVTTWKPKKDQQLDHTHTHTQSLDSRMVTCCSVYTKFALMCLAVRGAAWEHGDPARSTSCAQLHLWQWTCISTIRESPSHTRPDFCSGKLHR